MSKFTFDEMFNQLNDGECVIKNSISSFDRTEADKEKTVRFVFSNPANDEIEVVLNKVVILNEFYSTHLNSNIPNEIEEGQTYHMDVVNMAHHIVSWKQFNEYCNSCEKEKRFEAVDYIRRGKSDYRASYHREAYSFATKYCSWHNPDNYPILDSYSKGMLYYLSKEIPFYSHALTQTELNEQYSVFCDVYDALRKYLDGINKHTECRDLDKFLWLYGKNHGIAI